MKVLLISANTEKINILPLPLGLNCVAAATRNSGHHVTLLDLMMQTETQRMIKETIDSCCPDVIGISVRNIDDQKMDKPKFILDDVKSIVSCCRSLSNAPIVLGGAGYSIFPQSALACLEADMGIQGEGEIAFPALLDRMEKKADLSGTPGLYVNDSGLQGKRTFVKNLDELPIAGAHSFWHSEDTKLWMPFQTRRGCPMNCSYCSTATIEGRTIRKRSPQTVVDDLVSLVEAGFGRFYFVDNVFNFPASYARNLCQSIIERQLDITWRAILYPYKIDEALIHLMSLAGCKEVSLGFESGSEKILHNMNKKFTLREIQETSRMLARHGIQQMGFLMLGGPGETQETVLQSLSFADSLPLNELKITLGIRIYPGTALAMTAIRDGIIMPDDHLLTPKFYMVRGLETWLRETVKVWAVDRPHWMM
jgi:radical SAM superfamily enzyme YgiQ (UPF0313 family)